MLKAALKVMSGKQDGNLIPLGTKKFLIGREQDCQLRPGGESVSRHHCVINIDEFGIRVRDLGSSNGTLVNGKRIIGTQEVHNGDHLKIGNLEFEMVVSPEGVTLGEKGGTEFNLQEFELDEVSDTAVMSGDTAVIDKRKLEEQAAELAAAEAASAAEEASAAEAEAAPSTAEAPEALPAADAQPAAATEAQPQPAVDPAAQPALDPAAQMNPQMPQQPAMPQPGMPQPGMPYPPQQMPGYPGMPMPAPPMPQPGYPYGMPQPGYGMPPQPQYPMPYPQQQPAYPQPMPYPAQPAPIPEAADEELDDDDADDSAAVPPTVLPDPAETGLKDEPKGEDEDGKPDAPAPNPAEEVLKKYTNRR